MATPLFLPDNYTINPEPKYTPDDFTGYHFQWGAYQELIARVKQIGLKYVIDLGCGQAHKLAPHMDHFTVIGFDYGSNIDYCRRTYPNHYWHEVNFNDAANIPILDPAVVRNAGIICADVLEHLVNPFPLLRLLDAMQMMGAPLMIITTPDRSLLPTNPLGPPANQHHVCEWTKDEFGQLLEHNHVKFRDLYFTVTDTARGTAYETITAYYENLFSSPTKTEQEPAATGSKGGKRGRRKTTDQ